jgi:putative cardiolipin synthase
LLVVKLLLLPLACLFLSACQGLPQLSPKPASRALRPAVNPAFAKNTKPAGNLSTVTVVSDGRESFASRVALARFAKHSLDVQYFVWNGDQTGTYLLHELLDSADRGVRVRLLLDDSNTPGLVESLVTELFSGMRAVLADLEDAAALLSPRQLERRDRMRMMMNEVNSGGRDLLVAALDTHPQIEVRLFNPYTSRNLGDVLRNFELIGDFSRLQRRMHNKMFVADNQLAIVGGRNIADQYFGYDPDNNFRDLDLLVGGPAAPAISSSFDVYWNSNWAVPVRAFAWRGTSQLRLAELRLELSEMLAETGLPELKRLDSSCELTNTLGRLSSRMHRASVSVIADTPDKFTDAGRPLVAEELGRMAGEANEEILIETAYFIPVNRTYKRMEERLAGGVRIRTLTNSLASNDVIPAHAGYSKHRPRLVESGVELHELINRPAHLSPTDPGKRLHTKAVVFDRRKVFVGTFNLDPRSSDLNTEIGLLVDSPAVAREVAGIIERGMKPDTSWRVTLCQPEKSPVRCRRGQILWHATDPDRPLRKDPQSTSFSRSLSKILSWFPLEPLL